MVGGFLVTGVLLRPLRDLKPLVRGAGTPALDWQSVAPGRGQNA
jgi:hypothetical protein